MKRANIPKAFRHWAQQNKGRFRHPPYIYTNHKSGLTIRFAGVSRRIYSHISKHGDNFLCVDRNGEWWDGLADFDAYYAQTSDGSYYCTLCKEPELFQSRDELLIRHSWELMMEWVDRNFTEDTYICLYGDKGWRYAELKPEKEVENKRHEEFFVEVFSAIKKKPVKKG